MLKPSRSRYSIYQYVQGLQDLEREDGGKIETKYEGKILKVLPNTIPVQRLSDVFQAGIFLFKPVL